MAETLSILSIVSFAVAVVCFVLSIFFWIFFRIPKVIGDLTGRTARKSIAKMRAANEKTGAKSYKESKTNAERGKLTGTMPDSGKLTKKKEAKDDQKPETGLLVENKAEMYESNATGILESETTGLLVDEEATAPLDTSVQHVVMRTGGKKMIMIDEVILIHTDEVI